jgi:hypothetical protein
VIATLVGDFERVKVHMKKLITHGGKRRRIRVRSGV